MAFAPFCTYSYPQGDGSIIGQFRESQTGELFEFSENRTGLFQDEFPHLVWVSVPGGPGGEQGFRFARVLKTRAHVLVDDDQPTEVWRFKNNQRRVYNKGA